MGIELTTLRGEKGRFDPQPPSQIGEKRKKKKTKRNKRDKISALGGVSTNDPQSGDEGWRWELI